MALPSTMYRFRVSVSDVERGVYEELDLRVARHPSESFRYLVTRTLAYCLSYREGIAFSRGGVSSSEEPPVSVTDATGALVTWIEIGSPSADRLHRAAKAAPEVLLFTTVDLERLRQEAASRPVHRLEHITVFRFEPRFVDDLEPHLTRNSGFDLLRSDGRLYVTFGSTTYEAPLLPERLTAAV